MGKKDGALRPCIDYRGLNKITDKYRYPLSLVPTALEQLCTAKYFTKLNLRSVYNLIRIKEGYDWKMAFSTISGHYEYLLMPFGLANSPSVFQAFINDTFREMLNRWLIIYIDDILIYPLEEHIGHVRAVLERLIKNKLYAKLEKCEFHQTSISFLGYTIGAAGVAMDEQKVNGVLKWPKPITIKELQRFLGFANFYCRFIRNFSMAASPLTTLIREGKTLVKWNDETEGAFIILKFHFIRAFNLCHPNPELPFTVEIIQHQILVSALYYTKGKVLPQSLIHAYFFHTNSTQRNVIMISRTPRYESCNGRMDTAMDTG